MNVPLPTPCLPSSIVSHRSLINCIDHSFAAASASLSTRRYSEDSLRTNVPALLRNVRETPVRWSEEAIEATVCQVRKQADR